MGLCYHSYFLTAHGNCVRVVLVTKSNKLLVHKKLVTIIFNNLRFFLFSKIFFNVDFPNQSAAHIHPWLTKFVFSHRIHCPNFILIDNVQQCHFQFFELFWVILTPKFFSIHLKPRVRYSFGTPFNILRGKKSKILRVTARSIWVGMTHI